MQYGSLQPVSVPIASELKGAAEHVRIYNAHYARIATALMKTAETLRHVSETQGIRTDHVDVLASLAYRFGGDESLKEPVKVIVNPKERYPERYDQKALAVNSTLVSPCLEIPYPQMDQLLEDLEEMLKDKNILAFDRNTRDPTFEIVHAVKLGDDYKPFENLVWRYNISNGGRSLQKRGLVIDPKELANESSDLYKINRLFALFDRTASAADESGPLIPLGYNRLALMVAAQRFLAGEIEKHQKRGQSIDQLFKNLGEEKT